MIDRFSETVEAIRAAVILFADFAQADDFDRAEEWAAHAFALAATAPDAAVEAVADA